MKLFAWFESIGAAAEMALLLPLSPFMRDSYNREGATDNEIAADYPGDERVPKPSGINCYTRAITIDAPPEFVWAYLVQLGQNRGGMYSYDALENLAGCDIHTIPFVVPELQAIKMGDDVRFGRPQGYPVQRVVAMDAPRMLLLAGVDTATGQACEHTETPPPQYVNATWGFYLRALPGERTRLITRGRLAFKGGWGMALVWRITEVINYVMEQKMLFTFKTLAERDAQRAQAAPAT